MFLSRYLADSGSPSFPLPTSHFPLKRSSLLLSFSFSFSIQGLKDTTHQPPRCRDCSERDEKIPLLTTKMKTFINPILACLKKLLKSSRVTKHPMMARSLLHEMPTLQQLVPHQASKNWEWSNRWVDSDLKKFWPRPTTEQRLYRDRSRRHFLSARLDYL